MILCRISNLKKKKIEIAQIGQNTFTTALE